MLADLIFYMFAFFLLVGGLGVITAKNPMYCVLFMVLTFFNAAGLFILLGAEFIGLLMVMVYVGAIAVMFLFVLMTINIDFAVLREGFASYLPVGLIVAVALVAEFVTAFFSGAFDQSTSLAQPMMKTGEEENIVELGNVLFTNYAFPFITVSIVLLIAMVGAIVLTHRQRTGVKRQDITKQIECRRDDSIEMMDVPTGKGLGEQ